MFCIRLPVKPERPSGHTVFGVLHAVSLAPCMPRICGQMTNYALACQPVPMSTNPSLPRSIPAELGNLGALSILRLQNKQLTVELLHEPYRSIGGRKFVIPYQQSIVWCPCVSQAGRFRTPLLLPSLATMSITLRKRFLNGG